MIGDEIAAFLPDGQSLAESMMRDTCRVTAAGGEPVWDDETGEYVVPEGGVVYEGRCQLPKAHPNAQDADAGATLFAKGVTILKLPARSLPGDVGDPLAVADGHHVEITSRPGLVMTVEHAMPQTFEKSRKVQCQVVSRDARN